MILSPYIRPQIKTWTPLKARKLSFVGADFRFLYIT